MDRLWTPWRYSYITRSDPQARTGVPAALADWPAAEDRHCFVCLNAYPYSTGHLLIVPHLHVDSLAALPPDAAQEMMFTAQQAETSLRRVYHPDGLNLGLNLGEAAGAGIAEHIHLHALPRWSGDTNFMTVTGETRVLPETLDITWAKLRESFGN